MANRQYGGCHHGPFGLINRQNGPVAASGSGMEPRFAT
jgi:hypothetical protein